METVSGIIRHSIPKYLENLPVPKTFGGFFRLSFREWMQLVPPIGIVAYITYRTVSSCSKGSRNWINPDIHKENKKHVDFIEIESIGESAAFCRCWRSKKFPYCDGSHGRFNDETNDNVGPLLVRKGK